MLGINCLLDNSNLRAELKDLVQGYGYKLLSETGNGSFENVFSNLRKDGFEIDVQTLSYIYEEVFNNHPWFSSSDELAEARSQAYRDLIEAKAQEMKVKEIGRNNPVVAAVTALMQQVKLMSESNKTVQRLFQDRLIKAAKRVTGFKAERSDTNKTAEDILREVLSLENNNEFGPGFSAMENARRLWTEFKKEFNEMADQLEQKGDVYNADKIRQYADILSGATYKFLMSTGEVQKVIKQTLAEAGYTKDVNNNGKVSQIIDWNKIFADHEFDFTKTIKDVFRKKGFTEAQLNRIAEEMIDEWNAVKERKMASVLRARNADKKGRGTNPALYRLLQLYNMGIFNGLNQQALFNVLGTPLHTQQQINQIQQLMAINNQAMQNPVSQWSATYTKTIQRQIEIVIEQAEENKDMLVSAIRKWSFFNQLNNALLLSNPQNFTENTLSGAFQALITTIFTQPRQAGESLKILFDVFVDTMKGGVREGHEMVNTFNSSANLEDRFNFETAKTTGEKVAAFFTLMPRIMLSTFDNAFKAAMIHQIGLDMVKKELMRQGATPDEATAILNEAFYGNRAEIEKLAKDLTSRLQASNINVSDDKWKRIAAELSWGNLVSQGEFFQDVLDHLKAAGTINPALDINIDQSLVKSIRNAAEVAASKGLGHQSDSWILSQMDKLTQSIGQKVSQARSQGRGLASATAMQSGYAQINKFRYGALRWMWLTAEKTSGLLLLQTLITDVALAKARGKAIFYKDIDININPTDQKLVKKREEDLARYASLKQRLIRQSIAPIFGYAALTLWRSLLNGDDDDKKRELLKLAIETQRDRTRARWAQKLFPPAVYNYLTTLAWIDNYGRQKNVRLSDVKLPNEDFFSLDYQLNDLAQTFKNNYNQSQLQAIFESIAGVATNKKGSTEKLAGQLVGAMFTSPLKSYDLWQKAFHPRPLLDNWQYQKMRPEGFLEGVEKEFYTEDMWKKRKGVE